VKQVRLGNSNLNVSTFCLGTMMFGGKTDADESVRITQAAIDAGVNFIDTADVYNAGESERLVGQALADPVVRDQVVLASKAGMRVGNGPNDDGISRFHYVRAVEASLKRLKTDRIDLFYIHWPMPAMNLDETLRTLDDLVRAGKVLYVACSNFPAWLVCRCNWIAEVRRYVPLVCGQYPYNLIERGLEIEIFPMAKALGFGLTIYRPLAIGVLTGKYLDGKPDATRAETDERIGKWQTKYEAGVRKLRAFAEARGVSCAAAANAWVGSHPLVTSVIVGISRLEQLQQNLRHAELTLSEAERKELSDAFGTEIFEEAGGNFARWRRSFEIG
jgi:aryl-alcohol dehydrogenase-like predicted oxidoreductase